MWRKQGLNFIEIWMQIQRFKSEQEPNNARLKQVRMIGFMAALEL